MKAFTLSQNLLKSNFAKAYQCQKYFSDALVTHKNDPTNTSSRPFEFTPENWVKAREILAKYPTNYKKSASIPLMMLAQEQEDNFLSLSAMKKLAYIMECPEIDIFEVASFYTMFNRERVGKYHLQICGTTPCQLRGSREVIKAAEDHLGIKCGHTTSDMMYTIVEVECLGACTNAPMMQVNNHEFYEDLTPENTVELLDNLKNGCAKIGPQIDRNFAEGHMGRTTLTADFDTEAEENALHSRDFDACKEEWLAAKEAAANAQKK